MANLPQAKNETEIKALTVAKMRSEYNSLAQAYNKLIDGDYVYCHHCNEFISRLNFYSSKEYASGLFPICKKCLLEMVEQRKRKSDKPNETKDSVKKVLQMMNLPFIEELYDAQCKVVADEVNEKNRKSPFLAYLVPIKSLPQYNQLQWKDSQLNNGALLDDNEEEQKINQKTIKAGKKRFGNYPSEDLMFLENEYQDWIHRYECNTKAQESIFERLAFKKWEINKATKNNQPTKDLDKTYQELLATANIQPRQTTMDSMSDAQTFGTLIQKYEETRPLPEIDPELADCDKIGLYIDAFYRGHASKMLNIKNTFSHLYEKVMSKYAVKQPEYDDETDSEVLFDKIFGSSADD